MLFRDREQAAISLAERLRSYSVERPLVLGVPRGAVPMAKIIADRLGGELDIILVHKFASRENPEFALGSVAEKGEVFLGQGAASFNESEIVAAAGAAAAKLQVKRSLYTPHRLPIEIHGRLVIIVDDGIATGATMIAGVRAAQAAGAKRVVVATPVASNHAVLRLEREGARVEALIVSDDFFAVSQFFEDFSEVSDSQVIRALSGGIGTGPPEIKISSDGQALLGFLSIPDRARGLVVFAHGSGSGRLSPRNQFVAGELRNAGFATLLVDLLAENESESRSRVFDIDLLARRLIGIEAWIAAEVRARGLSLGLFGASTGAAAAIKASVDPRSRVRAIVSRGGRPDLATGELRILRAPTLLIVGGDDEPVLSWNRAAAAKMKCRHDLAVVPRATHLFEEPGALEEVARLAVGWFSRYLDERATSAAHKGKSN